jgi:hypothetical protein
MSSSSTVPLQFTSPKKYSIGGGASVWQASLSPPGRRRRSPAGCRGSDGVGVGVAVDTGVGVGVGPVTSTVGAGVSMMIGVGVGVSGVGPSRRSLTGCNCNLMSRS